LFALKNKTPPRSEPLTLAEAKLHLNFSEDDVLISALISAARGWCEGFQNRAYITQTWELVLDCFPNRDYIEIPLPPLQSVVSVKYYGTDDTEYTMSTDDYFVDTKSEPGRLVLAYCKTWPTTTLRPANAVIVEFVAGHPDYIGTVNTVATAVTKAAGDAFNTSWPIGKSITINNVVYTIGSVSTIAALALAATAGNQTGVAYQANDVPERVKEAIKLVLGHFYENREEVTEKALVTVPMAAKSLLSLDRVMTL